MLEQVVNVLEEGEPNGTHRLVRFRLPSGLDIFGLPTRNTYGGDWDLGPTWNYLVCADRPFLVDTGRTGTAEDLLGMMERAGFSAGGLGFILLSHGHEDHDGGLAHLAAGTGKPVKAHAVYSRLIRFYPDKAPAHVRKDFPAACWRCFMPESFSTKHCREYHNARSRLAIEEIAPGAGSLGRDIFLSYIPGHSPDSIAVRIGEEAILVGDTVLPGITSAPSREDSFDSVGPVLAPEFPDARAIYGLAAYLRSLKALRSTALRFPGLLVLPAHRLFFGSRWNEIDLAARVDELIAHHVDRCGAILDILARGPATEAEIARQHFEPHLLKGLGQKMAENEVLSHCELLKAAGDVRSMGGRFEAAGSAGFQSLIQSLEPLEGGNPA